MDPNDAAATGALPPGETQTTPAEPLVYTEPRHRAYVQADDLHVPGGATDPMWYLAATHLVPHMESTRKRGWIEGFVAGLEAARGIDHEPGVGEVLRNSLGMDVEVPVAVREPNPYEADVESLARFMFERQAVTYEADEETMDTAWSDPGVHEFWSSEARAVLRFLP